MATIVNLNLGGVSTTSYSLVLASPYTPPENNLLVLWSAPDIAPVVGTFSIIEMFEQGLFVAHFNEPVAVNQGTILSTEHSDIGNFTAAYAVPIVSGTLESTESTDIVSISGSYNGIAIRVGTLASIEATDTGSFITTYTLKWTGVADIVETSDVLSFTGASSTFVFSGEYNGFLNSTESKDSVVFSAQTVYDISGELIGTELSDIGNFTGNAPLIFEAESTDIVVFYDVLSDASLVSTLLDTVYFSDELDYSRDTTSEDVLSFSDELYSRVTSSVDSTDAILFSDVLRYEVEGTSTDTVVVYESLYGGVDASLTDLIVVSDAVYSSVVVSSTTLDTTYVLDVVSSDYLQEATVAILFSDSVTDSVSVADIGTDSVQWSDVVSETISVYADISDGVSVSADLSSVLTLVGVLSDTILYGDTLTASGDESQRLMVVNAETGAVSEYVFTPIVRGVVEYRGTLYLAGSSGLYAVDAEEDEDGAVVWTLRTGFSNLGTDLLKRMPDVNVMARTEGDTLLQVVTAKRGEKQSWDYRMPPLTRDSYRDGVIKVGRGLQSVYWQIALTGTAPAEIDQLRPSVEPLYRRR